MRVQFAPDEFSRGCALEQDDYLFNCIVMALNHQVHVLPQYCTSQNVQAVLVCETAKAGGDTLARREGHQVPQLRRAPLARRREC